jgi:hypothetical protein
MNSAADLPPAVVSYLRRFAIAGRRIALLRAGGIALAAVLVWGAFCCGIDRLLQLSQMARACLLACGLGIGALIVARALWRASGRVDWVDIAGQIERRDPRFSQSLLTVVSQLTGDRTNRGSEEMLSHVLRDVEFHVAAKPARNVASIATVATPWLACAVVVGSAIALSRHPQLGVTQLAGRFFSPLSDIPPVTTTQITVSPGDRDIVQSDALRIEARVQRLGGDAVFLFLNTQGDWYRVAMNSTDGSTFVYSLASVDRDVRYYVAAGDAVSRIYLVRVLRRPTVSQFQIRYVFPDYVRKPPVTVTNNDGLIEAPIGSQATLTIFCTDPLQSALLTVGSDKILMSRTGNDAVRRATFTVAKETGYAIDLISAREVAGSGPAGTRIHPLVDQPPRVQLFEAGQELRLSPRDTTTLTYEAADDYALTAMWLRVQINSGEAVNRAIPLLGNRRRQLGVVQLDLGTFSLKIGDIARISIVAGDSAGQTTVAAPFTIDISTRPIDLDMRQRVSELNAARGFATKLMSDFDAARSAMSQAGGIGDKQSSGFAGASANANLCLANASESATLVRQCLCRAMLHSRDAQFCMALADWSDSAESLSQTADDLFRQRGDTNAGLQPMDSALQRAIDQSRKLSSDVAAGWQAQLATVLLTERADAKAMKQPLATAQSDAELRALGVNLNADVDPQLQAKIDAGSRVVSTAGPIDYAAEARVWAGDLARGELASPGLDHRLSAAAEAEAVRPEADLQRARDLQLASRAAAAITKSSADKAPEASAAAAQANAFADALAALQQEWTRHTQPANAVSADQVKSISALASAARQRLLAWAPDADSSMLAATTTNRATADTNPVSPRKDAEDLALQASAAAAAKDYERAARLDDALNYRLDQTTPIPGSVAREPDPEVEVGQERVADSMAAARAIDGIGKTQDAVVEKTRGAINGSPGDLAGRERNVADAIAAFVTQRTDSTELNSRERAANAFLGVQEQLAAVPQKLADVLDAGAAARKAASADSDAQAAESRLGKTPSGDERGMAHRAVIEAGNEADEASDRLESALVQIDPEQAAAWTDELGPYAPESTSASDMIQTQLVPALTELRQVMHGRDEAAINRVASEVRSAVQMAQRELAAAQDALTARDPLVAARSFAGAAADSLAQSPPNLNSAIEQQVRATGALARAWDQSIHDAAAHRLAIVPSMQPVYGSAPPGEAMRWNGGAASGPGTWAHLQPREAESLSFPSHDSDPAGYEEPLRIYFQALEKAQAARGKGQQ